MPKSLKPKRKPQRAVSPTEPRVEDKLRGKIFERWATVWEPALRIAAAQSTPWIAGEVLALQRAHERIVLGLLARGLSWRKITGELLDDPRMSEEDRNESRRGTRSK